MPKPSPLFLNELNSHEKTFCNDNTPFALIHVMKWQRQCDPNMFTELMRKNKSLESLYCQDCPCDTLEYMTGGQARMVISI